MRIEMVLSSVIMALESVHILGRDAETLSGAIKALKNVVSAIDKATKEEQEHDDHDEQREDV